MWIVYVLRSERNGRYYIGSTDNLPRRLEEHNAGKTPSTRHLVPWHLIYAEHHETRLQARRREMQIKSWKNRYYMEQVLGLSG